MKRETRKPQGGGVRSKRPKRIRLYHFASAEAYCAIRAGGFPGDVYCAEDPKEVWGQDAGEVLLEVLLDIKAQELERYRLEVKWVDPDGAAFDHYYRIPPEVVNAAGVVRRVSSARRQKQPARSASSTGRGHSGSTRPLCPDGSRHPGAGNGRRRRAGSVRARPH